MSDDGGPGGGLLSHVLRQSTIGAEEFDGRVRDGIGFGLLARATRPAVVGVFEAFAGLSGGMGASAFWRHDRGAIMLTGEAGVSGTIAGRLCSDCGSQERSSRTSD